LECNSDDPHLIPYRILPKSVAVLFVQSDAVIPTLRGFNTKLVGPLVVSFGDGSYDAAALPQYIWDPPNKGRGIMQVLGNIMLGNFYRVAFLEIR
jgi:hypothetical protein